MNLSWKKVGLKRKVLIFSAVVATVPFVLSSLYWYTTAESAAQKNAQQNLISVTKQASSLVDEYLKTTLLGFLSHSQGAAILSGKTDLITEDLKNLLLQDPDITTLTYVDQKGQELVKVDQKSDDLSGTLKNVADSDAFKLASFRYGKEYISPVTFTDNQPFVTIAVPIVYPQNAQSLITFTSEGTSGRSANDIYGVLVGTVNLTALANDIKALKIGSSGYLYIIGTQGTIIAHSQDIPSLSSQRLISDTIIHDLITTPSLKQASSNLETKQKVVNQIPVITTATEDARSGWIIFAEEPIADITADISHIQLQVLILFLLPLTAVIMLSFLFSLTLTTPIKKLVEGTDEIGKGNFDHPINITTGDELQLLAESFEKMKMNIKTDRESILESRHLISAERNKLAVILSGITDAVIAVDLKGKIILFNSHAEQLTGYKSNEVLNIPIGAIIHLFDKDEELISEQFCPTNTNGFEGVVVNKTDLRLVTKSGLSVLVNLLAAQIKEGQDVNLGCILTIHDVTKEKQLEEMKLDFVAMAAHELRTPLTSLRGYTFILMRDYKQKFDERESQIINRLNISTQRLAALVENLLSVTKIERSRLTISKESIDWVENVREVVTEIQDQAADKNIVITINVPEKAHPQVKVDRLRINEVLTNLMANAINYTPKSGQIVISFNWNNSEVITNIADTGEGIPTEALPHLFTKFFRVNGKLEQGSKGTGLGLYISKSIIEMHNGKIWASSPGLGKGSTFSFSLPLSTITNPD